jgi:hypothetical protein
MWLALLTGKQLFLLGACINLLKFKGMRTLHYAGALRFLCMKNISV